MKFDQAFHALDLDDDTIFDDQIESIPALKAHSLVHDWYGHLLSKTNATTKQFIGEAALIYRLE